MTALTLDTAQSITDVAFEKARSLQLKPLCIAVVDAGGHVITLARQDGASTLRPQIAIGKACGALALGISSRKIGEIAAERPTFVASLNIIAVGGIIPAAGGIILIDANGTTIGAVGVTGDTSDNDELCALSAVSSVGVAVLA